MNLLHRLKYVRDYFNTTAYKYLKEPGSNGLDDRAIQVGSPAEAKDFSSDLRVLSSSGAHASFCPMGTEGPFPGGRARPGRDCDHSLHLVPRS
jgi:hypothetical protein